MKVISWNLHGAAVPGRATYEQQRRAWTYIADSGADLILAQEASAGALPKWSSDDWTFLKGERGRFRKTWNWGSVIAARRKLNLTPHEGSLSDPWLTQMYDLVVVGEINLGGTPTVIANVHSAAVAVHKWLEEPSVSLKLEDSELQGLRRLGCKEAPFLNDLAFVALARTIGGGPFLASGDWNTCRRFRGGPEFFKRAESMGWVECHKPPEEQSYFGRRSRPYQLDHAFTDPRTGAKVANCKVVTNETTKALSDHAPLIFDIGFD